MTAALYEPTIGDSVRARFTNAGRQIEFVGKVVGITKNYYKVASTEAVVNGWPIGHVFAVATWQSRIYSANNCVLPLVAQ